MGTFQGLTRTERQGYIENDGFGRERRLGSAIMNRREFLIRSSLLASSGLLLRSPVWGQSAAAPAKASFTSSKSVRRGVGYFTGRGGTIGYLSSGSALAVVDTQFPDTALLCKEMLVGSSGRTIDVTLNTHHHLDHTAGNAVFKPASKLLVAQALVPRLQFEAAQRAEAAGKAQDAAMLDHQVYASTTFQDVWSMDLGDETVSAEFHGPAHTGGDAVVYFEKANVVHTGDLVFNRLYPVIDRPGGASISGWIKALDAVAKTYPADALYIFGHGKAAFGVSGTRADLGRQRDFLLGLIDYTQKQIALGKPRSEIVALANLPGFDDWHDPLPNRLGLNLGAAYDELTGKKA